MVVNSLKPALATLLLALVFITSLLSSSKGASEFTQQVLMGQGNPFGDNHQANSRLYYHSLARDSTGNVYLTDNVHHVLKVINATNSIISVVAGDYYNNAWNGDGIASSVRLNAPTFIQILNDIVYFFDSGNCVIRKYSPITKRIDILLGTRGSCTFNSASNIGTATIGNITAMTSDPATNSIYFATNTNFVSRIGITENVFNYKYIGTGGLPTKAKYPTSAACYISGTPTVTGMAYHSSQKAMYFSFNSGYGDAGSNQILKLQDSPYCVTTFASDSGVDVSRIIPNNFKISTMKILADDLYVVDANGYNVKKFSLSTTNSVSIAGKGQGQYGDSGDNIDASNALFTTVNSIEVTQEGVIIGDNGNFRILFVNTNSNIISTMYGSTNPFIDESHTPSSYSFASSSIGMEVDGKGNLFFTEPTFQTVGFLNITQENSVINFKTAQSDFRSIVYSQKYDWYFVSLESSAGIFIFEKVNGSLTATTLKNSISPNDFDTMPLSANKFKAMTFDDETDYLFVVDGDLIRRYHFNSNSSMMDTVLTIAGPRLYFLPSPNKTSNDITPYASTLNSPTSLILVKEGAGTNIHVLYFTESSTNNIRKVLLDKNYEGLRIDQVLGKGTYGYTLDDVYFTKATLNNPSSLYFDSIDKTLYFSDSNNNALRSYNFNDGMVRLVVGNLSSVSTLKGFRDSNGVLNLVVLHGTQPYVTGTNRWKISLITQSNKCTDCTYTCSGVSSTDPTVCSGNGACISNNVCSCSYGYFGSNCQSYNCTNTGCSNKGYCANSTCVCQDDMSSLFTLSSGLAGTVTKVDSSLVTTGRSICYWRFAGSLKLACGSKTVYEGTGSYFKFGKDGSLILCGDAACIAGSTYVVYKNSATPCAGGVAPFTFHARIDGSSFLVDSVGKVCWSTPSISFNYTSIYVGEDCRQFSCNGVSQYSKNVCSGHGSCVHLADNMAPVCSCNDGYFGSNCETQSLCNNTNCNGQGVCQNDVCNCNNGYGGTYCEAAGCNGVSAKDPKVCSGNGKCAKSVCICSDGSYGANCQFTTPVCAGLTNSDSHVCSGRGSCISNDVCMCETGFFGSDCEAKRRTPSVSTSAKRIFKMDEVIGGSENIYYDGGAPVLFKTHGMTKDVAGNLYISDTYANVIRMISPQGIISLVAGVYFNNSYNGEGDALSTHLSSPSQLLYYNNMIYFTENNCLLRRYNLATRKIELVLGKPGVCTYGGDETKSVTSGIISSFTFTQTGILIFYADYRLRWRAPDGYFHTYIGNGASTCYSASAYCYTGLTAFGPIDNYDSMVFDDATQNIYASAHKSTGTGNGILRIPFNPATGIALGALVVDPLTAYGSYSCCNPASNPYTYGTIKFYNKKIYYINLYNNNRIMQVQDYTTNGSIAIIGTGTGNSGDNGLPTKASFGNIVSFHVDSTGFYIGDQGNSLIRFVPSSLNNVTTLYSSISNYAPAGLVPRSSLVAGVINTLYSITANGDLYYVDPAIYTIRKFNINDKQSKVQKVYYYTNSRSISGLACTSKYNLCFATVSSNGGIYLVNETIFTPITSTTTGTTLQSVKVNIQTDSAISSITFDDETNYLYILENSLKRVRRLHFNSTSGLIDDNYIIAGVPDGLTASGANLDDTASVSAGVVIGSSKAMHLVKKYANGTDAIFYAEGSTIRRIDLNSKFQGVWIKKVLTSTGSGSTGAEVLSSGVTTGVTGITGVFYDKLSKKLYFSDTSNHFVRVLSTETSHVSIIAGGYGSTSSYVLTPTYSAKTSYAKLSTLSSPGALFGVYDSSNTLKIYVSHSNPSSISVLTESNVCSSISADEDCDYTCGGISYRDTSVCSGSGVCMGANTCKCNAGYSGSNCETFVCSNYQSCNNYGYCNGTSSCICQDEFTSYNTYSNPASIQVSSIVSGLITFTSSSGALQVRYNSAIVYTSQTLPFTNILYFTTTKNGTLSACSDYTCATSTVLFTSNCAPGVTTYTHFRSDGLIYSIDADGELCYSSATNASPYFTFTTQPNAFNSSLRDGVSCGRVISSCNGLSHDDPNVCSGNGACINSKCVCKSGYSGTACSDITCFGKSDSDPTVCNGNGTCVGADQCDCTQGSGPQCQIYCDNLLFSSPLVCGGVGSCVATDTCVCDSSYSGQFCNEFSCNGVSRYNDSVCDGFGRCISPDLCECSNGVFGTGCSLQTCDGTFCNKNGICLDGVCSCNYGFFGDHCEQQHEMCGGIADFDGNVCNGRGLCNQTGTGVCFCSNGWKDPLCSTIIIVVPTPVTPPSPVIPANNVTNSTNPANNTNPSNPSNPTNPTNPTNPSNNNTNPVNNTNPIGPNNPPNPSNNSTNPNNPNNPNNPPNPSNNNTNPSNPSNNSTNPTNPSNPSQNSTNPSNPSNPTNPTNPTNNTNPSNTTNPTNPTTGNVCNGLTQKEGGCSFHGNCRADGSCACFTRFTGVDCSKCITGFTGVNCSQCVEGKTGSECKENVYSVTPACVKVMSSSSTPFCASVGVMLPLYNMDLLGGVNPQSEAEAKALITTSLAKLDATALETFKAGSSYNPNCTTPECLRHVKAYACYSVFNSCFNTTTTSVPFCRAACEILYDQASRAGILSYPKNTSCEKFPETNCNYGLYIPDSTTCFGKGINSADVCSKHGTCVSRDICQCVNGFTGPQCEIPVCFGLTNSDSSVCSGKGSCIMPNTCSCKSSTGVKCEIPTCNGKSEMLGGCSFRGKCNDTDSCICRGNFDSSTYCLKCLPGWVGPSCETPLCFNIPSTDNSVCGGKGECVAPNTCECKSSYSGPACQSFSCHGILRTDASVCGGSSRGKCVAPNTCSCATNWNNKNNTCTSCSPAYSGDTCANPMCTSEGTCNSKGTCDSNNKCVCSGNFKGEFCSLCKGGFVGANCDISCSPATCNSHGACTETGTCKCDGNFDPAYNCTSGKCIDGYLGDACNYKVDSESFKFNSNGDRITGTIYNTIKRQVPCSQIIASLGKLGTNPHCNLDGKSTLEIVLGVGATITQNEVLSIYSLLGDSSTTVNALVSIGDFVPLEPTASLTSDKSIVSKCDVLSLNAFDSISLDRRPLSFTWNCTDGPSSDDQTKLNNLLSSSKSGQRVNMRNANLGAGFYTVQVTVTSAFGYSTSKSISFTLVADAAPTLSIKEGLTSKYLIGSTRAITPIISFPTCYNGSGATTYSYSLDGTVSQVSSLEVKTKGNMMVLGSAFTNINLEGEYYFDILASADSAASVTTRIKITAEAQPISVSFSVPDMTQSKDDPIAFKIIVKDPSNTNDNLNIATTCVDSTGVDCIQNPGNSFSFTSNFPAGTYIFTSIATKGSRTAKSILTISVTDTSKNKIIRLSITSNVDLTTVDPTKDLYLTFNTLDKLQAPTYAWSSETGDYSNTSLLIIPSSNIVAGAFYSVSLTVQDGIRSGIATITFTVNSPPTLGTFEVYPTSGYALSDSFDLKCGNGWSDPQTPLKFQFFYLDSVSSKWNALTEKTEQQSTTLQLPQPSSGTTLTIKAVVFDALGAASSTQTNVEILKPTAAAATTALTSIASGKDTVTLAAASSAMTVIGSIDNPSADQKAAIQEAAASITDAFLAQQAKTESVTSVSAASAENSLSFTASVSASVSKGLVSDSTTSKVVENLANTTAAVAKSSSVSLSDSVIDGTTSTAQNFLNYIKDKVSKRSFTSTDISNLNSVFSTVSSLKIKDAVPDAPPVTLTANGVTTYSRKVNIVTLNGLSQVVSGKHQIVFKNDISTIPILSNLTTVNIAAKTSPVSITGGVSNSIELSVSDGSSLLSVSSDSYIADLVFEIKKLNVRSVDSTALVCKKLDSNGVPIDVGCTISASDVDTATASVKSTGSYVVIQTNTPTANTSTPITPISTPVTPISTPTKSTKLSNSPMLSLSTLLILIISMIVLLQ